MQKIFNIFLFLFAKEVKIAVEKKHGDL